LEIEPLPTPQIAPAGASVIPTRALPVGDAEDPFYLPVYDWQSRVASYLRGIAAVGLSLAGAFALVLALVATGSLRLGGFFAPVVDIIRAFVAAASMWLSSLLEGIGPQYVASVTLVLGLLAFAGWQVVSNYHHAATEHRALTGPLEAVT